MIIDPTEWLKWFPDPLGRPTWRAQAEDKA